MNSKFLRRCAAGLLLANFSASPAFTQDSAVVDALENSARDADSPDSPASEYSDRDGNNGEVAGRVDRPVTKR